MFYDCRQTNSFEMLTLTGSEVFTVFIQVNVSPRIVVIVDGRYRYPFAATHRYVVRFHLNSNRSESAPLR